MREIRPSGSEGGVAITTPSLPLSFAIQPFGQHARESALTFPRGLWLKAVAVACSRVLQCTSPRSYY